MIDQLLIAVALAVQLTDVSMTCHTLRHGGVELNPIFGRRPTCSRVALVKAATLIPIPFLRGRARTAVVLANITGGTIGVSMTIYYRKRR